VLSGQQRAVVSPVAGTTRDILSAAIKLNRGFIRLSDLAGLEDDSAEAADAPVEQNTPNHIDRKMREHALRALAEAEIVILVREAGDFRPELSLLRKADLKILSKCDLTEKQNASVAPEAISVSATTGKGLSQLRDALDQKCFGDTSATAGLTLHARHVQAIVDAKASLSRAAAQVQSGAEFVALELRQALDALGQITGNISPDDLLGRVFSAFCIGK
jgi:tRNA modification GTPase